MTSTLGKETIYLNCTCQKCKAVSIGSYQVQSKSCVQNDRFVVVKTDTQNYVHMDALHMPEPYAVRLAQLLTEKPSLSISQAIILVYNT